MIGIAALLSEVPVIQNCGYDGDTDKGRKAHAPHQHLVAPEIPLQ